MSSFAVLLLLAAQAAFTQPSLGPLPEKCFQNLVPVPLPVKTEFRSISSDGT
ncbi:hypothetical protein WDW86_10805 [Bdellovibrionota bacterium FG-2]